MYGYLELLQREDPTWSIEELRELVGLARSDNRAVPPGPSVYEVKVAARTLRPEAYQDFSFPSAEAAAAAEQELGDEFDTTRRPPDFKTLRVWGHDQGIDR